MLGSTRIPDGELIDVAEGRYDILVTLDRSLTAEQKIQKRKLAVIVLRVGSQSPEAFHALVPALRQALSDARPGDVVVVTT